MSLLFKAPRLRLTARLSDGTVRHYRVISGMARSGFLLSPLVTTEREFAALYPGLKESPGLATTAIQITGNAQAGLIYRSPFRISFDEVTMKGSFEGEEAEPFYGSRSNPVPGTTLNPLK